MIQNKKEVILNESSHFENIVFQMNEPHTEIEIKMGTPTDRQQFHQTMFIPTGII